MENRFSSDETRERRRVFSRIGWALTALLGIQAAVRVGLQLAGPFLPWFVPGSALFWLLYTLPTYLLAFPGALLVLRTLPAPPPDTPRPLGGIRFLRLAVICLAGLYLSNLVSLLIIGLLGQAWSETLVNPISVMTQWPAWLTILVSCILAPAAEELLFRRELLLRLKPYGDQFAIFASALLFSLIHGNLFQLLYAFTAGVCFAYIALRTGSIRQSMALHALVNGISAALLPLMDRMETGIGRLLAGAVLVVIFSGIYQFFRFRKEISLRAPEDGPEPAEIWGTFLVNPGMTIFCLLTVLSLRMMLTG